MDFLPYYWTICLLVNHVQYGTTRTKVPFNLQRLSKSTRVLGILMHRFFPNELVLVDFCSEFHIHGHITYERTQIMLEVNQSKSRSTDMALPNRSIGSKE